MRPRPRTRHTKNEIVEALRREETNRGLTFEYCLITAGTSLNRAASDQTWEAGEICRSIPAATITAISATCAAWRSRASRTPSSTICSTRSKDPARRAAIRSGAGLMGREIYATAEALVASRSTTHLDFLAHGMGLVSHEAPRLTNHGPVPYPATMPTARSRAAWWSRWRRR